MKPTLEDTPRLRKIQYIKKHRAGLCFISFQRTLELNLEKGLCWREGVRRKRVEENPGILMWSQNRFQFGKLRTQEADRGQSRTAVQPWGQWDGALRV